MQGNGPEALEGRIASDQHLLQACSDADVLTLQRHFQALSKLDSSNAPPTWPSLQTPSVKQMLLAAISAQSTETLTYLLTTFPTAPIKEDPILLAALETQSIPILTLVLHHDPTIINHELEGMRTLLSSSFSSSDPTIPTLLLDNGADPNLGIAVHMSPLYFAIRAQQPLPVIEKMVDKGAEASGDRLALWRQDSHQTCCFIDFTELIIFEFVKLSSTRNQQPCLPRSPRPRSSLPGLITGCSSGFGLSLTRIAQAGGHTVIATSRNPSCTPELVAEVEGKGGEWLQLDVDSPNSAQVIEDLEKSGQEIDVLVNNAGFSIYAPIETFAEDEIRAEMESMYFGPLRLIRAVLPHMRKRRFGVIVNMSSGAALEARDSMGAYAGAKAGLDGLTKVLAKEVAPFNIRALTVVLGTFNTNMGNAAVFGKNSLPDDYKGSVAEQTIQFLSSGKIPINGDKDKAMKAVYEVVVGEGAGAGREAERFLPLGTDMTARVEMVQEYLAHGLEVFRDVTNNVSIDK